SKLKTSGKLQTSSFKSEQAMAMAAFLKFDSWRLKFLWSLKFGVWSFLFGVWGFGAPIALAQSPGQPPPVQDPLMSLMLSQPKIDIEGPVTAIATFDPPVVRPGQQVIYRVTFNNALEQSVQWPAKLPSPPGLEVTPGAQGQLLQMTGPTLVPLSTFNSRV